MVTILLNKSVHTKYRPGTMLKRILATEDFTWSSGKIAFEGIIVIGDKQYPNGTKLKLFIDPIIDEQIGRPA